VFHEVARRKVSSLVTVEDNGIALPVRLVDMNDRGERTGLLSAAPCRFLLNSAGRYRNDSVHASCYQPADDCRSESRRVSSVGEQDERAASSCDVFYGTQHGQVERVKPGDQHGDRVRDQLWRAMGEAVGARRKHHGPDPVPGLNQPVRLESPVCGSHGVDVRSELIG
jgi:hypothetical protein